MSGLSPTTGISGGVSATNLTGTVPVSKGGTGTSNGAVGWVSEVISPANSAPISILTFTPVEQILGTAAASSTLLVSRFSNDALFPRLVLAKSRNATIGSHTVVQVSDQLGQLAFCADDGTNFASQTNIPTASIESTVIAISGLTVSGNLLFKTQNGSGALTLALTINDVQKATFAAPIRLPSTTVVSLTGSLSAASAGAGAKYFVTDALGPVFGATVVGGGAVFTPVYSDGTNWKVG